MRRTVAWLVAMLWLAPSTVTMLGCGDDDGPKPLPNSDFAVDVEVVDQCARLGRPIQIAPKVSMTFEAHYCNTEDWNEASVDFGCNDSNRPCDDVSVPSERRPPYHVVSATCAPDCTAKVVDADLGQRVEVVGAIEAEANVEIAVAVTVDETGQVLEGTAVAHVAFQPDGRCESKATAPDDAGADGGAP